MNRVIKRMKCIFKNVVNNFCVAVITLSVRIDWPVQTVQDPDHWLHYAVSDQGQNCHSVQQFFNRQWYNGFV